LNTEYFIAKRIAKGGKKSNRFSKPIIVFATIGVALSMIVMILSVSIVTGFQTEIKNKVVGFGSHIQINNPSYGYSLESTPMHRKQAFLGELSALPQIKHIQSYAIKPGIIRSNGNFNSETTKNNAQRDILGVIVKGVGTDYDWTFLENKMEVGGSIPNYNAGDKNDSIIISRFIANKLNLKLFDRVSTYFIKDTGPKERKFFISAIYNTGLEDFDKQFVFADIRQIQELNLWGIEAALKLKPNCNKGAMVIEAQGFSENKNIQFSWNDGPFTTQNEMVFYPTKDTVIQVVAAGFGPTDFDESPPLIIEPDTCYLSIEINNKSGNGLCENLNGPVDYEGLNDSTLIYHFNSGTIITVFTSTNGSRRNYVGGYEVILNQFEDLKNASKLVRGEMLGMFQINTIDELHQDIFGWLDMLDANVYIIIVLMVIVALINMTVVLLILILERTNMIGVLKALGTNSWSIQKIFLINGVFIILKGLLIGNFCALLVILLQQQFGFIQLDQTTYFVQEVPMYFTPGALLILNCLTILTCFLVLLLPALFVSRITPIKAIRFD